MKQKVNATIAKLLPHVSCRLQSRTLAMLHVMTKLKLAFDEAMHKIADKI